MSRTCTVILLSLSSSSHCGHCSYSVQDCDQGSGPPVLTTMQAHVAHISLNGTAAVVRTASTLYPTSSGSTSHRGTSIDTDGQRSFKPSESTSEDPEKGVDS